MRKQNTKNQPSDLSGAPRASRDTRRRTNRFRPHIDDEKQNQLAGSNGAPSATRSSDMSGEERLGFDPRKRDFDVDRIMQEASERRLKRDTTFERLSEAYGTRDTDFVWGLTQQLISATANFNYGEAVSFSLSFIRDMKPKDHVERLLLAQMSAVHLAMMNFTDELAPIPALPINLPKRDSAVRALASLTRTYTLQLSALKRYRSGGEQRVTVQHFAMRDRGQSIVGNIDHKAPVLENTPNAAPALTDARQPAMEPIAELKAVRVPRKRGSAHD